MASSNLQIDNGVVKDDLNCVRCKSILKDACLVPCGCRLCRVCINDLMASGVEFCPGPSEECGGSPLSQSVTDYRANRNISKFPMKCPSSGCVHECLLTNMEEHLRVCPKKIVECPFREFGCTQDKMAAEEMSDHLQRESLSHSELLIGMINNINNEREGCKNENVMMKQIDEDNRIEIENLKKADESNKKEIEMLKQTDETNKKEIDLLKNELNLRSGQVKLIINENLLIKEENKVFTDRVKVMLDEIKHENGESRETCKAKVIEYVDKEIQSINQGTQTMKADIDSIKLQMQSKQVPTDDSLTETVLGVLVSAFGKHKGKHGADLDVDDDHEDDSCIAAKKPLLVLEPPEQQIFQQVGGRDENRNVFDLQPVKPQRIFRTPKPGQISTLPQSTQQFGPKPSAPIATRQCNIFK